MTRFEFQITPLAGLKLVQRKPIKDDRGFFARFFCVDEFLSVGMNKPVTQINQTLTRNKGSVRGLHFQYPPFAELKIVSCIVGSIFDIAVDLRANSSTFLNWHGEILSAENHRSLLIPEGFAHGFQALTDNCELLYLHTASYNKESEGTLNFNDPRLEIKLPLPVTEIPTRDQSNPFIDKNFSGLIL